MPDLPETTARRLIVTWLDFDFLMQPGGIDGRMLYILFGVEFAKSISGPIEVGLVFTTLL